MKKVSRPQYARVRRILALIREGMAAGRLPNARDFGLDLGVSRPTVMRDLDWLRDEENAPIEYEPSSHGYRLGDATWELPPVSLSQREVFAFSVGSRLAAAFHGTPLEMDMQSAFKKIAQSMEGKVTLQLESLTERLTVLSEDYVRQDPETWALVARHVDRSEAMHVRYERFDGVVKEYELEPCHLVAYHGNWYVLARTEGHDEPATFAVSRIRSIVPAGRRFSIPEGFDPGQYLRRGFGIAGRGKPMRVGLLFSARVAGYVRERVWHPMQRTKVRKDGSVEIRFETDRWMELVRFVLSWQPDCRVLSPRLLHDRVVDKMRGGIETQTG